MAYTSRPPRNFVAIPLGCAAGLLAAYVTAYVLLGANGFVGGREVRFFQAPWQARLFAPAARVESAWTGRQVEAASWDG
jgi:hypothetical protein